jgi:hypothetical protein
MTGQARSRVLGLIGLALLGGAATGCSPGRTMLVVRVESNLVVPDALDSIRVVVTHAGKEIQSLPFALATGTHKLPLQIGLLSPSGGGMDVEIAVTGILGKSVVVTQDAITSFVKDKSLALDMFLAAECVNFDCHDPSLTCTKGQVCVSVTRIAANLPTFDPHGVADVMDAGEADAASDTMTAPDGANVDAGADATPVSDTGGGPDVTPAPDAVADVPIAVDAPREAAPEAPPACVPKTEDCFNGLDDDCDGLEDCADPDCTATAVCVPMPSGDVGTSVAGGQACPPGFPTATMLKSGLQAGGATCAGCQCGGSTTTCASTLSTFLTAADCAGGTNGKVEATFKSTDTTACVVPDTSTPNVYGASLTAWTVTSSGCAASGTPVKPPGGFTTSTTFCRASAVSAVGKGGCAAGSVCAPKAPAAGGTCVLLAGTAACPTGTKAGAVLYSDFTDTRSCAACTCGAPVAACDNLIVQMGSDYGCGVDFADIHGGARTCETAQAGGVYTPGYHLAGVPAAGSCTPQSAVSGTITPTGGRALCCVP